MLRTNVPDFRRSSEAELLQALAAREPLALAEAYHRTVPAAYACGRRLLGAPAESEALLRAVYAELWAGTPADRALEAWVRQRCFQLAAEHLQSLGRAPATPSAHELLPDLPAPSDRSRDPVEEILAGLEVRARMTLVAAHDRGISTARASEPRVAAAALEEALLALAGPQPDGEPVPAAEDCDGLPLGDWVLGLLDPQAAEQVEQQTADRETCLTRARALRRGRRRLEGLPPTADLGQRVLASILAGGGPGAGAAAPPPSAGEEIASALDAPLADEPEDLPEPAAPPDEVADAPAPGEDATEGWEPVTLDVAQPEQDEEWPWEEETAGPRRGFGRRVLAVLGVLLLIGLGVVAGAALGSLVVGG